MSGVISSIVQAVVGGLKGVFGLWAEVVEEVERTLDAEGVQSVQVRTSSGSIALQGADQDQVVVRAWKTVRGPSQEAAEEFARQVEVHVERQGNALRAYVEVPRPHFGYSASVRFEVMAPRAVDADLRTSSGGLRIAGTEGAVEAKTHSGGIELQGGRGRVHLRTSSGGIHIAGAEGTVDAETSSGSIELREGVGSVRLHTSSGGIRAALVRLGDGGTFTTHSGSIHVEVRAGVAPIAATTSSGGVHLTLPATFSGQLEAHTSSGGVHCDLPAFAAQESRRNHLVGRIGEGGEATVKLRTASGSVHVRAQ